MTLRPALLTLLASLCVASLHAQRGDRACEVQLPPAAHIKVPPAPVLAPSDALKTFKIAPGFRIELHIKDLANAIETGHEIGVPLPLTSPVMKIMQALKVDGKEGNDHSGIVRFYERWRTTRHERRKPEEERPKTRKELYVGLNPRTSAGKRAKQCFGV